MTNKLIGKSLRESKTFFLLSLFLISLLSSCGIFKSVSIEKRLYRPGYSISTNSVKIIPAKNTVTNENKKNTSNRGTSFTQMQRNEIQIDTKGAPSSLPGGNLKKVKTNVSTKGKTISSKVKNVLMAPIHKAKTIPKSEKIIPNNETKGITEGKSYSLSTVLFVIGAVLIIWGLSVLFGSIAMMSADIALALTIIIGLALVIIWGLIVLMVKSWFNGTDS